MPIRRGWDFFVSWGTKKFGIMLYDTLRYTRRMNDSSAAHTNGMLQWQWLTVGDVARTLRLTEERVRQLIRERKIKATKIGGWLVQPDDLKAFIRSRTNVPEES